MERTVRDYEEIRNQGLSALSRGEPRTAAAHLEAARNLADRHLADDHPGLVDQAEVNLAMVRVHLHEEELAEEGLREVLLRSADDDVTRLATHCLAKILSHRNDRDKALKFARMSLERARRLEDPTKIAGALSLLGSIYCHASFHEKAVWHYEEALTLVEAHPGDDRGQHAFYWCMLHDYIGYALILMGNVAEGRLHVETALERARHLGLPEVVAETSIDLCFAWIQQGDPERAIPYGEEALRIAEAQDLPFFRRNCYYLLGDAWSRLGETGKANEYFDNLSEFFPDVPYIAEFLSSFDVSQLIDLKEYA